MSKQAAEEEYSESPVHEAVVRGDHAKLRSLVGSLPRLSEPSVVVTESESLREERNAEKISSVIDRRDVADGETPLHVAVRMNDACAASILAGAGADISLQNAAGWNPLQEALCRRSAEVALLLVRMHHRNAWAKWRRRMPRLLSVLRRMPDFYMELSFHFDSSLIPFVGKMTPSDTYRIWKRDANLRADTSLAGFEGLKIQRAHQSFLFLGEGDPVHNVPPGSLLVLNHDDRKVYDAFETAAAPMSDSDVAAFCAQTSVYRPGMDVTRAHLVPRTNWRRQHKTEMVGDWKAKLYDLHNVLFTFRSRKAATWVHNTTSASESFNSPAQLLQLDEDDDGFLVAENPGFGAGHQPRRHSSFVPEERDWEVSVGRKSVDIIPTTRHNHSHNTNNTGTSVVGKNGNNNNVVNVAPFDAVPTKEKESIRSLRPSVWLTDHFPLKTEELLPLLDILANKVKAVRRLRELLTTTFPPGTFPVKVAIPVVPTVRVVVTFTKFVELPPTELFYTPVSSPRHLNASKSDEDRKSDTHYSSFPSASASPSSSSSSSTLTWLRRNSSQSTSKQQNLQRGPSKQQQPDPFVIPKGYVWASFVGKSDALKKSKSVRRSK